MSTCLRVYLLGKKPLAGQFKAGKNRQAETHILKRAVFNDRWATESDAVQATSGLGSVAVWGAMRGAQMLLAKNATRLLENPCEWDVEEIYTLPEPGDEPAPASPSNDRWQVSIALNPVPWEEEIQTSVDGKALVNSTTVDPVLGVKVPRSDEELIIEFTTDTPDWANMALAMGPLGRGCVNSQAVTMTINGVARVFAVRTLHWEAPSTQMTVDVSGAIYSRQAFRLMYRKEGWKRRIPDMGLRQWGYVFEGTYPTPGTLTATLIPFTEKVPKIDEVSGSITGYYIQPVSQPQYLDGTGHPLMVGDDVFILPDGNGFELFEEADLGAIILWDLAT